uniref:Uncharacterized protein n=1 Tax=Geospiza parvula TaxID=87175 RepID=A0A8U8B1G6_GEOPR
KFPIFPLKFPFFPPKKLGKAGKPRLVITEQPKQRGMRFRYECEGRSAGSILGENSTESNRTLPTTGPCPVAVTAVLVWKDWPHRVHPHGLVGKDCAQGLELENLGILGISGSFSNLGIQCVKKKEIEAAIEKKLQLAGSLRNHQEVDLNVVRICFQASFRDRAGIPRSLSPVLSQPIFDKSESQKPPKSPQKSSARCCPSPSSTRVSPKIPQNPPKNVPEMSRKYLRIIPKNSPKNPPQPQPGAVPAHLRQE